ncbi:MAG TPA: thioredoxin family protein, partial [bacterium]|nr:thioredoxin family protein [bacterium]
AGTPVLVDFSAQWCLTCLVNERVALGNPAVRSRLQEAGVATLRADWTDTNAEIARALGSFGRASVPLYVFYPGGGRDPVILPEILTPGIVLSAIGSG